jgi:hypothetical protein
LTYVKNNTDMFVTCLLQDRSSSCSSNSHSNSNSNCNINSKCNSNSNSNSNNGKHRARMILTSRISGWCWTVMTSRLRTPDRRTYRCWGYSMV